MMCHQEGQKPFFHYFLSDFVFTVNRHQIVIITLDTIALQWNTIALQWKFSNCYVKYMLLYMKVAKNLTVNRWLKRLERNPRGKNSFYRIRESTHFHFLHFWSPWQQIWEIFKTSVIYLACFNHESLEKRHKWETATWKCILISNSAISKYNFVDILKI